MSILYQPEPEPLTNVESITLPAEVASWSALQRRHGRVVGFVPTMGALHEGHIALVKAARDRGCAVAASIFVNPLQFNNAEDLKHYPRQLEQDMRMLADAGCDVLFAPTNEDVYRDFKAKHYDLGGADHLLEGASRPGHFQGVVNVVERLFHYVRPDLAFFGEKDRQQLAVLRFAAEQQRWPVEIIACPTFRAADGLALSSRNQRLSESERLVAPVLYRSLIAIREHAFRSSAEETLEAGREVLATEPLVRIDYLSIAHTKTLEPLVDWGEMDEAVALVAAWLGPVRLIDNITLRR